MCFVPLSSTIPCFFFPSTVVQRKIRSKSPYLPRRRTPIFPGLCNKFAPARPHGERGNIPAKSPLFPSASTPGGVLSAYASRCRAGPQSKNHGRDGPASHSSRGPIKPRKCFFLFPRICVFLILQLFTKSVSPKEPCPAWDPPNPCKTPRAPPPCNFLALFSPINHRVLPTDFP